jgi:hypothetical protein
MLQLLQLASGRLSQMSFPSHVQGTAGTPRNTTLHGQSAQTGKGSGP